MVLDLRISRVKVPFVYELHSQFEFRCPYNAEGAVRRSKYIQQNSTIYSTMKTLSVKQVSEVLGVSTRAILKRLDKKQLKGTRRLNKFGVEEWWIYPTAEIKAALEKAGRIDVLGPQGGYADADIIDVDGELTAPDEDETSYEEASPGTPGAWTDEARNATEDVAEGVWNNIISRFLGELKERDQLIGEMRSELAEKDRQLKLLPDFQKQAEEERKATELKELEAEALRKQIAALQEMKQQEEEARCSAEEELQRLKDEKEAQVTAVQQQLQALSATVQELQKPKPSWWKKLMGS